MPVKEVGLSVGGRRAMQGLAASLVGGTFLAHYLPQTLLMEQLKEVTQGYRKSQPIALPAKVTTLVQEVMEEMNMAQHDRDKVHLYTSYGFELYHGGSTQFSTGALLGLPASLKWESVGDFEGAGITVNNAPVDFSSEAGQSLRDSLIFSPKAKKFVIARELSLLQTSQALTHSLIPTLSLTFAYSISIGLNHRLKLHYKPRIFRLTLYVIAGLFGYCSYILGTDMTTVSCEGNSDGAAAAMGRDYAEGGVEFYRKVLQRNVALRHLMGSDGNSLYSAKGNDEVLLRTKHLPFTMRLDELEKHLKKYEEGEGTDGAKKG